LKVAAQRERDDPDQRLWVCLSELRVVGVGEIRSNVKEMKKANVNRGILVFQEKVTSVAIEVYFHQNFHNQLYL